MGFNPMSLDTRAASDAGVWLTLTDTAGNEIWDSGAPVQLHLIGRDSAVAKEALSELQGKTGEALDATAKAALVKLIKGWSENLTGEDGKPLPVTAETKAQLVEIPHIAEWVLGAAIDRANFTTKPRKK